MITSTSVTPEEEYELEYEPERFTISGIGGFRFSFEILSVVPPPLEYMLALHTDQKEISGRQVWCGSLLLSRALLSLAARTKDLGGSRSPFAGKRILELGSGAGLVGMTSSKLGAQCVALTDGDNESVTLLQHNLENEFNSIDKNVAKATLLLWGSEVETNDNFSAWCRQSWPSIWAETETVQFDCILAGDVMYKEQLPNLFFASVTRYLVNDGNGLLYLCHVPRSTVTQVTVISAAQSAGLYIERIQFDRKDLPEGCPMDDAARAALYIVTRNPR